jgi:transglutaminase-like putative cysteine protease
MGAHLVPRETTIDTVGSADGEYLAETNRLQISNERLTSEEPDPQVADFDADGFSRTSGEGSYVLEFFQRDRDIDWDASFIAYKSSYIERSLQDGWNEYKSYVRQASEDGSADLLASIIESEAEANGFRSEYEKFEFVVDFVQNLPYVPDDVSAGYDEYRKSIVETIVEGGGDCEDSALLTAAILQADSFLNYDCILICPPEHVAVGVWWEDVPGGVYWEYDGRKYYYLETTGEGWQLGELPTDYEGESARIYPV